jgi:outer membrane receptor for ferrienterochelin and colicins
MWRKYTFIFYTLTVFGSYTQAQERKGVLKGAVTCNTARLDYVSVGLVDTPFGALTDSTGSFRIANIPAGKYKLKASSIGYFPYEKTIEIKAGATTDLKIELEETKTSLNEVVVTGTMRAVRRSESPVPIEIYTPRFFRSNPTPNLFESLSIINGVKPQINCNVCNTGDIHMNGMEGPYTMILIDGMPIVSALSTVYGLSGIPNSMVERLEIVKGPASSLYGSEAMGGIINVITKTPSLAPVFSADVMTTSWLEHTADISSRVKIGNLFGLFGANYHNFWQPYDKNNDSFTDMTQQKRFSFFNKWNVERPDNKAASVAMRYVYENRWGGQTNWDDSWRGSDSIYGESIYTNRFELIGTYQLPLREKLMSNFSFNVHDQDSYYGVTRYKARQNIAFGQLYWDKSLSENNNMLIGSSIRYTWYDDNTPATAHADSGQMNNPNKIWLPGVFIQDEIKFSRIWHLLLGLRYDYDKNHGHIISPRTALKVNPWEHHTIRSSFGTGYRVVNLFTEDHAALTGAREVIILEDLLPERSYNVNLNYSFNHYFEKSLLNIDVSAFYSYFTNQIIGDFEIDPNKIIYKNLDGHAITRGVSLENNLQLGAHWKFIAGITLQDVFRMVRDESGTQVKITQLHAPKWSGNYTVSYTHNKVTVDLTGFWDGPMRLPVLPNDYRPPYSPWFTIANVQVTKRFRSGFEMYAGLKNLLNFVPKNPIMRPFDPFDKNINDQVNNPHNYTFDPGYNYAPLQGLKGFLGLRFVLQ